VTDLGGIPSACEEAGEHAFEAYVQLPATFEARGDTAIQRVRHFYADGVLARFTALDAVLGSLTPAARVTCVLGTLPPEADTAEDVAARRALVHVLANAAQADAPGGKLNVRVLDSRCTARDIAFVALGGDLARQELMDRLSDVDYQEWRVELFGLTSVEM
jgi:hypothetical protein